MNKIAKNYIYNLIYQLLILFIPLITAPYLARTLLASGTGIFSFVNSFANFITTVTLLGIYSYGNRQVAYVRDNKEKLDETFWSIMSARFVLAIIGTILYIICVIILNKYLIYCMLYYTYMLAYFLDCTWLYVGVEDMKWAVIKNTVTKCLVVCGIFLFVRNENDTWKYVLLSGLSILISNLLAYSQLKLYVGRPKFIFKNLKNIINQSVYLFLPSFAATIYLQCDKIMIGILSNSTEQVSFYDYSEKIITIPLTFITVLNTIMMPRLANEFANGNKNDMVSILEKAARFSIFLAFPLMFGLMAVASKLVPWYLGDEFIPVIWGIILIAPIVITNTLSGISGTQYFTATNQTNILLKAQIAAAMSNVIINTVLIPKYGFYGASIATVISSFMCAIVQYYYLLKQIKLYHIFKDIIKYFSFSLVMFLTVFLLTNSCEPTPEINVIQILIGGITYFVLCVSTKDKHVMSLFFVIKNTLKK